MSEEKPDDGQRLSNEAYWAAERERQERAQHVRDWWVAQWACVWSILAKLAIILGLAIGALDLRAKLVETLSPVWPAPVDNRGGDRSGIPYRPSRGH